MTTPIDPSRGPILFLNFLLAVEEAVGNWERKREKESKTATTVNSLITWVLVRSLHSPTLGPGHLKWAGIVLAPGLPLLSLSKTVARHGDDLGASFCGPSSRPRSQLSLSCLLWIGDWQGTLTLHGTKGLLGKMRSKIRRLDFFKRKGLPICRSLFDTLTTSILYLYRYKVSTKYGIIIIHNSM